MATVKPLSWSAYYARNRDDDGVIQSFFDSNLGVLASRSLLHLRSISKFTETITGSACGNAIFVPGPPGKMSLIHHGFSCLSEGEFSLVFVQGNLSDCSYFKILPREEVVEPIKVTQGRRVTTINCPLLGDMLSVSSAEEFKDLPAAGNGILRNRPNHLLINGDVFLMTDGAPSIESKDLAMAIIDFVRPITEGDDADDDEILEAKQEAGIEAETLLAMLWASENEGLTPVPLLDVPNSCILNQIIRNVKGKLLLPSTGTTTGSPTRDIEEDVARGTTRTAEASAWAISSQSIVQELNRMHESREAERALKEASMSLLKTLNPSQKKLFTSLCTTDLDVPPVMSAFMSSLTKSASPQKAIGILKVEAGDWEGMFSEGCCHRFLSNGFLSLEASRGIPGGFTVFMFHPKTVDMGGRAFDTSTATLRDYFGMDLEDATVAYYAKQGFFHPTNSHDLRIQLETALEMLELLTCPNSIATQGLHYIVNPKMWRRYSTRIHDRFLGDKSFGSKFLYSVDLTLQTFFDRVARGEECKDYLVDRARELMDKLQSGSTLGIQLPSVLLTRESNPSTTVKRKISPEKSSAEPAKSKPKVFRHASEEHTNPNPHMAWLAPKGVDFLDLFKDRAPGMKNWPKFVDKRLPKKKKLHRAAPLCVRFQMTTKCTHGCSLAHIFARDMSTPEFNQADRLMQEALTPAP